MQCPFCDSPAQVELREHRMTELGTDSVLLRNVPVIVCPACGEEALSIPNYNAVMRQVREKICHLKRKLRPGEFMTLRLGLKLTGLECARLLGVTNVSISRWENGAASMSLRADRGMRTLALSSLGYSYERLRNTLLSVSETGLDEVVIDVSNFRDGEYVYETCQVFGDKKKNQPAWVLVNEQYGT